MNCGVLVGSRPVGRGRDDRGRVGWGLERADVDGGRAVVVAVEDAWEARTALVGRKRQRLGRVAVVVQVARVGVAARVNPT